MLIEDKLENWEIFFDENWEENKIYPETGSVNVFVYSHLVFCAFYMVEIRPFS